MPLKGPVCSRALASVGLWSSHSKGQGLGVEEGAKNHERSRQAACARSERGRDKQSRGREGSART